jgi:hypothetical protein
MEIRLEGVENALKMFDPQIVVKAARQAVNRVATTARKTAMDVIQQEYNFKSSRLRMYLLMTSRASGYRVEAVITGKGMGTPLYQFDARQVGVAIRKKHFSYTARAQKSGNLRRGGAVTVKVKKGGGRATLSMVGGQNPFIAKTGAHLGVWVREGTSRLPLVQLWGPGVGGLFGSKKVMDPVVRVINDRFPAEFKHQLDYYRGLIT